MIVSTVHFNKGSLKIIANIREDIAQAIESIPVKYASSILGNKDKVNMHLKNAVSSMPNFLAYIHRP